MLSSSSQRSYVDAVVETSCYTFQEVDTSSDEEEHRTGTQEEGKTREQQQQQQQQAYTSLISTTIPFAAALENDNGASSSCASCSDEDLDSAVVIGNVKTGNELLNLQVQPLLPDHISLHTLRRVVREQWGRLVIRKVRIVKSEVDPKSSLLKFIDAPLKKSHKFPWDSPFKSGETIVHHDATLERADLRYDCSACVDSVTLPITKWYYGFTEMERANTDKRVRMANKFLPVPPTVSPNQFIYFNCRNARGFDMSLVSYAWFAMTPFNDMLRRMPPPIGSYIAGTVKYNKQGAFFDRWFYPSEEFLNLYHLVMGGEEGEGAGNEAEACHIPSREEIVTRKGQLDCNWMWFWQFKDYMRDDEYLDKEHVAKPSNELVDKAMEQRKPFSIEKRIDIMKTKNAHLFDASTAHEPLGLYYFYQLFCTGQVFDWEHTSFRTLEQTSNRLRHAVCYHYRKSLKRQFKTAHGHKRCESSGEPNDTCKHVVVRNIDGLMLFCTIRQQQQEPPRVLLRRHETIGDESSCAVVCAVAPEPQVANRGKAGSPPSRTFSDLSSLMVCGDWGELAAEIDDACEQQQRSTPAKKEEEDKQPKDKQKKKKKKQRVSKKRLL